jgi:hypothetical protein
VPKNQKKHIFQQYQQWLVGTGLKTTNPNVVLCPLCWQEIPYDFLSVEHVIPESVGGKDCILTCKECNNLHGSQLDSHVSQFQHIEDVFKGHGKIPATLTVNGKKVTANIEWKEDSKNIEIVGKASNPTSISAIQKQMRNQKVDKLQLTLKYEYIQNRLETGLLRCAYLTLFKFFGYKYAITEPVQVIRQRISEPACKMPDLAILTGTLKKGDIPWDGSHVIVPAQMDGLDFFFVILLLRKKTTTYRFVLMPGLNNNFDKFYDMAKRFKEKNEKQSITINFAQAFI